ncbi:MAG: aminoacyl-tRNA hydrolase [Deltaproteobacteria bacterium]|nr:aminoacyl-tRNA hydrolase [Deltaproteobacteria bacterium]
MIEITSNIAIGEKEIEEDFIRSSGPGGQNVNKVATAVQLRFDIKNSPGLPEDVRHRLLRLAGKRVTSAGVLIIHAARFRTQERNRKDAMERLITLIRKAAEKPRPRRATAPTRASITRRLESKRRSSHTKRLRRPPGRSGE